MFFILKSIKGSVSIGRIMRFILSLCLFCGCSGAILPSEPLQIDCGNVDTSSLQGTIKGKWRGQVTSESVGGSFVVTVGANGVVSGSYDGPDSGPINGCIDHRGGFKSVGTGANFSWEGQFHGTGEKVTASGKWVWSSGGGSGTWSGHR
jgi:hypothetical protein